MSARYLAAAASLALAVGLGACTDQQQPVASAPAAAQPVSAPAQARPSSTAPAWQDLNGARASSGESALESRGFELSTRRGLTAFWNHATSQTCLRVVTSNGRYTVSQVPFTPQNCPL
jgi:hypothetical protein